MKYFEYVFVFVCIIVFIIIRVSGDKETKRILHNAKYTIGTVTYFNSGTGTIVSPRLVGQPGDSPFIKFVYTVNGLEYENSYSSNISRITVENTGPGDKYVVAFDKNDPQKSRILFDKPIKNDTDFKKYLQDLDKK